MADYEESSVTRSAVNWSFKDTQLKFYEMATAQFGNYMMASQGLDSEPKCKKEFISSLLAYHSTVLNGFSAYLRNDKEHSEYKKDFPNSEDRFAHEDYEYWNIRAVPQEKLIRMCKVLFFWSQQHGPFATLTKHIDPGDSWALG